jgi:hypothetical protein
MVVPWVIVLSGIANTALLKTGVDHKKSDYTENIRHPPREMKWQFLKT